MLGSSCRVRHWYLTVLSPGHLAGVLEAEDLVQWTLGLPRTVGRFGHFGRDGKLGVVAGQEVPQHDVGLVDGFGASQAQLRYQSVLKGSGSAFHTTLGLWRASKDLLDAQLLHSPAEVSGLHRRLDVPGLAGKT